MTTNPTTIAGFTVRFASPRELALFKPAGTAVELSNDTKHASLIAKVRDAGHPHARLPHRLDRVTSGLVLCALDDDAIAFHNEQIRAHRWRKCYVAKIAKNTRKTAEILGKHRLHLKKHDMTARVVRTGGDAAETTVLAHAPDPVDRRAHQLLLEIHTGRFHQIRATLAHLGSPLVGDTKYDGPGPERAFFLEHAALRFTPCASETPAWVFSRDRDDPASPIAPELTEHLRALAEE